MTLIRDKEIETTINRLLADNKAARDLVSYFLNENMRLKKALRDILAKEYVADCKDVVRAALKESE